MVAVFDPEKIIEALAKYKVEYVLIGGMAAVLHGSSAMTNDADIFPNLDPANLERLSSAIKALKGRIRTEDDVTGLPFDPHPSLLATMKFLNLTTKHGDLDIAFEPDAMQYKAVRENSIAFTINRRKVYVAHIDDIIRSKSAAGRAKDKAAMPLLEALRKELDDAS